MCQVDFQLVDIKNGGSDPFELHLFVKEGDRGNLAGKIVDKDFIFRLSSDWIVSSGRDSVLANWYIKGCQNNSLHKGNAKYYNKKNKTSYFKAEFNKDLRGYCPHIEERRCLGKFDVKQGVMTVIKKL